jgi:putative ABC transport system substrate-binding protein
VVFLATRDEPGARPYTERFLKGMREAGQIEGRTFRLEVRYAHGDLLQIPALIRDAVASRPDVLVVVGLAAARDARDATSTVPVVVVTSSDLVDGGVVRSFAHPGGNITGITDLADEATVKRLQLLKETLPNAARVALLLDPNFPATPKIERNVGVAARAIGVKVIRVDATDPVSLVVAFDSLKQLRPDALLVGGSSLFALRHKELVERATAMRIPVIHYWPGAAEAGALISHQVDIFRNHERAAWYVDRILKGTKPSDLPIEQPMRYELIINLKTAKALGLTVPAAMMIRADRVIE